MTTITLPVWVFLIAIATPILSLLWIMGTLVKKIRKPKKTQMEQLAVAQLNQVSAQAAQFHNDLLALQIDSIFNGMNAIIETERIKIRSLLNNSYMGGTRAGVGTGLSPSTGMMESESKDQDLALFQRQKDFTEFENEIDDRVHDTALSKSELELAKKMRATQSHAPNHRLEAVA